MTTTMPRADVRTYRSVTAEQTWARIAHLLPAVGITRVADVTGLDELGIPVYLAVRPTSRTLAVSQGKGLTPLDSRISAVMESIETWHAENLHLAPTHVGPASAVTDAYDLRSLSIAARPLLTDSLVLEWVTGQGLLTGTPQPVPLAAIGLDARLGVAWEYAQFMPSSNGLASGNTATEAKLHGLLEIIERDCTAQLGATALEDRRYTDPRTAAAGPVHTVLDGFEAARCWLEVCDATNELGVPCYVAYTWAADLPVLFAGAGCHPDATVALLRALTEAAQSRLTFISGTRDDFANAMYRGSRDFDARPPVTHPATEPVPETPHLPSSLADILDRVARRVTDRTGTEPFAVDLTRPDLAVPVWRTFAPGLHFSGRHEVSRG
ncbi:YcaO-like family protein [Parafrankia elaeagni]|uniref:YcaO-like family protein n=1 Tax=Parafrankia elaeagni TaxID=222534 RepID=UPI00037C8866|nr:YcaO-like family protein [Parafrankia elaeagni]